MITFMHAQTEAFSLCTTEEMEHRLEELEIDEKLKFIISPYLLQYADGEKAASGVSSVIRGMLRLIAPHITDEEYECVYLERVKFIRAIVENWEDANTTIAYCDGLLPV